MKHVLFIDVRNTARSRMAEAWFNRIASGWGKAESCGTMPAREPDPLVAQVLREVGVSLPDRAPRPLRQQLLARADLVVILGKELNAQAFGPVRVWDLPDPNGQPLGRYRLVRDAICRQVEELGLELRRGVRTADTLLEISGPEEGELWRNDPPVNSRRANGANLPRDVTQP